MLLKEIGLTRISIGAESGIQRILDEMKKDVKVETVKNAIEVIQECGIETILGWIAIIPTMSFDELKENYHFLFNSGCYSEANLYNKLNLYKGCSYEEILARQGLIVPGRSESSERHNYTYADPRVDVFAQMVDLAREVLRGFYKQVTFIEERSIETEDYRFFKHIRSESLALWRNMIEQLLLKLEDSTIRTTDLAEFIHLETNKFDEVLTQHNYILR